MRLYTFETSGEWVGIALIWLFAAPLIVVRYGHARLHDRPGGRLTRAEVRYGMLLVAIAALLSGRLTQGPTEVAGWVFALALIGFGLLTAGAAVRNRRSEGPLVS